MADKQLFTELNFDFITVPYNLWSTEGYFFAKPIQFLSILLTLLGLRRYKDILGFQRLPLFPIITFSAIYLSFYYFELNTYLLFGLLLIPTKKAK